MRPSTTTARRIARAMKTARVDLEPAEVRPVVPEPVPVKTPDLVIVMPPQPSPMTERQAMLARLSMRAQLQRKGRT